MTNQWTAPYQPHPPAFDLSWDNILDQYDWLHTLDGVPQDPIFHAEGDVLTHTRLVTEALVADADWRELDKQSRSILFMSALLHDVAKPLCTIEEDGRIKSPGHAVKGRGVAQDILYRDWNHTPVSFDVRQQIVALVRYHGLPLWFLDKRDMERAVVRASLSVKNRWIALLAKADVRGRICDDQQDLLDRVDMFQEYCEQLGCWDNPPQFPSNYSRFEYFRNPTRVLSYPAYDDTQFEVILMCGLPGAGKDSWIANNIPDWKVVSLDDIREQLDITPTDNQGQVITHAKELARTYLREQIPFVWNATNITRQTRRQLVDLFTSYRACVRLVYCEAPWDDLMARNQERVDKVPRKVITNFANRLQIPDLTEAHQVDFVISH